MATFGTHTFMLSHSTNLFMSSWCNKPNYSFYTIHKLYHNILYRNKCLSYKHNTIYQCPFLSHYNCTPGDDLLEKERWLGQPSILRDVFSRIELKKSALRKAPEVMERIKIADGSYKSADAHGFQSRLLACTDCCGSWFESCTILAFKLRKSNRILVLTVVCWPLKIIVLLIKEIYRSTIRNFQVTFKTALLESTVKTVTTSVCYNCYNIWSV